MTEDVLTELCTAIELARRGARVAADAFGSETRTVRHKADGSPVTPADLAVEDLLRTALAEHFPDDGVLGEERPSRPGSSGRRWIIDPISGTADFVHRVPLYSVDLALEDEHGPVLAVSDLPASCRVLAAGRGVGCWVLPYGADPAAGQEHRARVSGRTEVEAAVVCALGLRNWPLDVLTRLHATCALRDGVHAISRLLTGRADAIVVAGSTMSYEDLACLPLLVEEAGGRVTDLAGAPVLTGDGTVLATNGTLHEDLLGLLADDL